MNASLIPTRQGSYLPISARMLKRGERVLEPDVYVTPYQGQPVVVKDYRRYRGTPMALPARLLVWREARILRRLRGWRHAPVLLGSAGLLLGMEFVAGSALSGEAEMLTESLFRQLRGVVARLHADGILHNDLHTSNFMLAGGTLVLLDYASALRLPRWMLRLPLLREFRRADLANALRIQKRLTGRHFGGTRAELLAPPAWVSATREGWKRLYRWAKA